MELLLLIAWVLSPFALIPAVVILAVCNSSLKKENTALKAEKRTVPPSLGEESDGPSRSPADTGRYARPGQGAAASRLSVMPAASGAAHTEEETAAPALTSPAAASVGGAGTAGEGGIRPAVSPVGIVLAIGAVFILLAGLIFATTTWRYLSGPLRVALIGLVAAVFFAASWFAEGKLRLRQTGRAFYALGCLFLPVTMLAVGYFELFGAWFSLNGEGRFLLGMAASLAAGIAFALGARRYALPLFAWPALSCASLSAFFLLRSVTPSPGLLSLLLSLFCAALVLAAERVRIPPNAFSVLTDRLRRYAACNLLVFGAWTMLTVRSGLLPAVSTLVFALLFLSRLLHGGEKSRGTAGVALFTVFWIIGVLRINGFGEYDRTALLLAAASSVVLLLSSLELFCEEMRRLLNLSFGFCAIFALAANLPAYFQTERWTAEMLASTAILTALVTLVGLWRNDRVFLLAQPFFLLTLLDGASTLLFPGSLLGPFSAALFTAAAFWLYRLAVNPKNGACLRTAVSDLLFPMCCLLRGIQLDWKAWTAEEALLSIAALLLFCSLLAALALEPWEGKGQAAAAWLLPHGFLFLLSPVRMLAAPAAWRDLFLGYLLLLACASIALLFVSKPAARRFDGPLGLSLSVYGPLLALDSALFHSDLRSPGLWIFTVYWGVRLFLTLAARLREERSPFGIDFAFGACAAGALLSSWMTAVDLFWPGLSASWLLCAPTLLSSAVYLFWLWLRRKRPDGWIAKRLRGLCVLSLPLLAAIFSLTNWGNRDLPAAAMVFAMVFFHGMAYHCLSQHAKTRPLQLLPLLWIYPLLLDTLSRMGKTAIDPVVPLSVIAAFFVLAVLGRALSPGFFRLEESLSFDWFSIVDLFAPLYLLQHDSPYWNFGGWLMLGLWFLFFYRRTGARNADRIVLTAALFSLCGACWAQPFWEIPAVLSTEWLLLSPALLVVAVRRWIWVGHRRATGALQFGYALAAIVLLGLEAMAYERPADALILGVIALVMLIAAFALHLRRWFALSASTLLILAVYMTRGFWSSLAWWIYLLAVGLLLIGAASLNEFCRQRGESLRGRIARRMERWRD